MRQRVEDLGRLCVLISKALESSIFEDGYFECNNKFLSEDDVELLSAQIMTLKHKLYDCLEIAEGEDRLNLEDVFPKNHD